MIANFSSVLKSGDFSSAMQEVDVNNYSLMEKQLLQVAYESESITVYSFICHLLIMRETSELHRIAAVIMSQPLCFVEGAYVTSYHHIKRAIELSPENAELKEFLLFLAITPDRPVPQQEAINIAKEILKAEPVNQVAIDFLNKHVHQ